MSNLVYRFLDSCVYESLPSMGGRPSAKFKIGSFVRVRDTPPTNKSSADTSSDKKSKKSSADESIEDKYLMQLRAEVKWVPSMNRTCSKVGIVCDGFKQLGCTRVLFKNRYFTYWDEWLLPVDKKDLDKSLRDPLERRYETLADITSKQVFSGQSAFHFVQPQYVRVLGPNDIDAALNQSPFWTVRMNETIGKVGMVAGGVLHKGLTDVLFDDGTFYIYKDEWLCSVTQVVGESQFLRSETESTEQVDSSVWQSMRERYLRQIIGQENVRSGWSTV